MVVERHHGMTSMAHLVIMSLHTLMESTGPATENFSNSIASVTCTRRSAEEGPDLGGEVAHVERGLGVGGGLRLSLVHGHPGARDSI